MNDKPISLVETLFALLIVFSVDVVEVLLWMVGMGFLSIVIDIPIMLLVHVWLKMKGGRWEKALFGNAIETLPIPLDILPLRSIFLLWSIHETNNPKTPLAL